MTEITLDQYILAGAAFTQHFAITVVNKADALEMHVAALALDVASIMPAKEFIEGAATTIGTVVYIPAGWDLERKLVALVHEGTHVRQYLGPQESPAENAIRLVAHSALTRWPGLLEDLPLSNTALRVSGFGFWWLYLTEREERARFEAEAYAASMEIYAMLHGEPPTVDSVLANLKHGYALRSEHVDFAETILRSRRIEIADGHARSTCAIAMRAILQDIDASLIHSTWRR